MHGDLRTLCYSISCPDRVILEGLRLREWLEPAVDLWSWHLCGGCYELFGHLHKDGDLYQQAHYTTADEAGQWPEDAAWGWRMAAAAGGGPLATGGAVKPGGGVNMHFQVI